jgi:uncharacterized protein (TIGR03435 family)
MRTLACAGSMALVLSVTLGQDAARPAFEVASVKPNTSGGTQGGVRSDPERLTATNATVRQLLLFAYNLPDYQLLGPHSIETERYDVTAKAPIPGDTAQLRSMLQTLLTDRFRLKLHRETKTVPVFWLITAKNGPKLRKFEEGKQAPAIRPGIHAIYAGFAAGATVPQLADLLSRYLQQPVLDKTGVDGRFSIQLEWAFDATPQAGAPGPETSDPGASLFTAVQEQLGLKLEPHRSDVEFLVIDSVQKPLDDE